MIGNAHLDLAWLWPWQEGFGEVKATFMSALQRLDEFDGFIFTSSSAQHYAWLEENEPELFAQIRLRIQEGRWIICGGWWVQPDCNLPGAESFVRQGLYGQQYFKSRFGVTASVAYNVDSFGHNSGLPQIFLKSGMDSYMFLRPMEHELDLPKGAFYWEGPDGSRLTCCRIPANYSSIISLEGQLQDAMDRYPENSNHFICFYGVGNHGGGPTIANIRYLLEHMQLTEDCQLTFSHPRAYFDAVAAEGKELPVWSRELQHHAPGCYSVNSQIKEANRATEHALVSADIFSVLAAQVLPDAPAALPVDEAWQQLLTCQFHDILSGSSVDEVCLASLRCLGGAHYQADRAVNHALQAMSFRVNIPYQEHDQPLVVFNPHSFPVKVIVCHEKGSWGNFSYHDPCCVVKSDGSVVPHQFVRLTAQLDERKRIAFLAELPPLGYETFSITSAKQEAAPIQTVCPENVLENQYVRVALDPESGLLTSLFDKQQNREMLSAPASYLMGHHDPTDTWGHGAYRFDQEGKRAAFCSLTRMEDGPVYQQIQVCFRLNHSSIRVRYTLRMDSPNLESEVKVDWQGSHICLKYGFPLNLRQPKAAWEVPFGTVYRPTTGEEEPAQTWMDLSDSDGGLAIVNHAIGGAHIQDATVGLTLLRCPFYSNHAPNAPEDQPDDFGYTDQGLHTYRFLFIPHGGSWQDANIPQQALLFNRPPIKVTETFHTGPLPQHMEAIHIDQPNILLSCWKPAYDGNGTILRLWEAHGAATTACISLPLLSKTIAASFTPYEVKTFRIDTEGTVSSCSLIEFPDTTIEKVIE